MVANEILVFIGDVIDEQPQPFQGWHQNATTPLETLNITAEFSKCCFIFCHALAGTFSASITHAYINFFSVQVTIRLCNRDLVFPSSTGRYQSASNVHHRPWKPALKRAERPSAIRFHDLRHTYASMVKSAGVPLSDLKVVLGHSSIVVTADIYGHLLENSHDRLPTVFAVSSMPDAVDQPIAAING
jgi:hypothetical protein